LFAGEAYPLIFHRPMKDLSSVEQGSWGKGARRSRKMIRVLFFARFAEELGVRELSQEWQEGLTSRHLLQSLGKKGRVWQQVLSAQDVKIAVNQELINGEQPINDGDEVAFFPPMTGG
jgi:molybdopterin synthase sulfur carrier subunit